LRELTDELVRRVGFTEARHLTGVSVDTEHELQDQWFRETVGASERIHRDIGI
jgi:hypothetical protein